MDTEGFKEYCKEQGIDLQELLDKIKLFESNSFPKPSNRPVTEEEIDFIFGED